MNTAFKKTISANTISQWRTAVSGDHPTVLSEVYQDGVNLVVWQRQLSSEINRAVSGILEFNPNLQTACTISTDSTLTGVGNLLGNDSDTAALKLDIADLVDMFGYLFDLNTVGLRFTAIDRPMCPRFHTDYVPCRLITTYCGNATEWLPDELIDRAHLGTRGKSAREDQSTLYTDPRDVQQLNAGDVALLKGDRWRGNEGKGLVHRSPEVESNELRLLLTLDFAD